MAMQALKRHLKAGFSADQCITAAQIEARLQDQGKYACEVSGVMFDWTNPLQRPVLCLVDAKIKSYGPANVLVTTRAFRAAKGSHSKELTLQALYEV